jgi:hypothetical protein
VGVSVFVGSLGRIFWKAASSSDGTVTNCKVSHDRGQPTNKSSTKIHAVSSEVLYSYCCDRKVYKTVTLRAHLLIKVDLTVNWYTFVTVTLVALVDSFVRPITISDLDTRMYTIAWGHRETVSTGLSQLQSVYLYFAQRISLTVNLNGNMRGLIFKV